MTTKLYQVPETNARKDKISILFNKINSLLALGLNCDTSFHSRSHLHDYLYVIGDLFDELEAEVDEVLK